MNDRERLLAVLNYENYDRLPVLHFGFWDETLQLWAQEGHITFEEARTWADGNDVDAAVGARLGFDYNYYRTCGSNADVFPAFERKVLEQLPDGSRKVLDGHGVVLIEKDGATGIPPEVDHLLKGRQEWDTIFKQRLQYEPKRLDQPAWVQKDLCNPARSIPLGLHCGSLYGNIRGWTGMVNLAYMQSDDPALFDEMIETQAELCYQGTKAMLSIPGAVYDFGHFWEDICFKNGPLVNPKVFQKKVGPGYRRITELLHQHGLNLVSLDCDGKIDALIPTWIENGVNVMFPIEVGVWDASIQPWREKYGKAIRGVGGTDKKAFATDYKAVDREIERLKPLVELGGYIPCPDHRLPPNAKWENVQYYCERLRKVFG